MDGEGTIKTVFGVLASVVIFVGIILVVFVGLSVSEETQGELSLTTATGNFETSVFPSTSYSLAEIGDSGVGYGVTSLEEVSSLNSWLNLTYNGTNSQYVNFSNSTIFNVETSNFSIFTRIKPNEYIDGYILSKRSSTNFSYNMLLQSSGNITVVNGSGTVKQTGATYNPQEWSTIAYNFIVNETGTYLNTLKNGVDYGLVFLGDNYSSNEVDLLIGQRVGAAPISYIGAIDYLYLYNRTLNSSEIIGELQNIKETTFNTSSGVPGNDQYQSRLPRQKNTFYANDSYWLFYGNNTNDILTYTSSTDLVTWTEPVEVGVYPSVDADWTIYFDGENVSYARNSNATNSGHYGLIYQKGLPLSNGTISWYDEPQQVIDNSSYIDDMTITVDYNGCPWIVGNGSVGGQISSSTCNGTWTTDVNQSLSLSLGGNAWGLVEPLAPQGVLILETLYSYTHPTSFRLRAVEYNGTHFTNNETNITQSNISLTPVPDAGVANMDSNNWNGSVFVVFNTNNSEIKFIERSQNGTWSDEVSLAQNYANQYSSPVISVDNDTGNLFVFWHENRTETDNPIYLVKRINDEWTVPQEIINIDQSDNVPHILVSDNTGNNEIGLTTLTSDYVLKIYYFNEENSVELSTEGQILNLQFNEGGDSAHSKVNNINGTFSNKTVGLSFYENNSEYTLLTSPEDYNISVSSPNVLFSGIPYEYVNGTYLFSADSVARSSFGENISGFASDSTLLMVLFVAIFGGAIVTLLIKFAFGRREEV